MKFQALQLQNTVKLGFKERLNKEQLGNSEPFPVTNLPVFLINSEQIGISEQFCDDPIWFFYLPNYVKYNRFFR